MNTGFDFIGVTCVFYCHDGKGNFLLHKRSDQCRDEIGRWDCGGGKLEFGESWEEAVKREVKEEYCVNPLKIVFTGVNNLLRSHGEKKTHWIALIFKVKVDRKKVRIGDEEKMEDIGWFKPGKWPTPLHSMFLTHFDYTKKVLDLD